MAISGHGAEVADVAQAPLDLAGAGWAAERQSLSVTGYLSPLPLAEPERAEAARAALQGRESYYSRIPHCTTPEVLTLLRDPGLQQAVLAMFGSGYRLWRSALFTKSEGQGALGWHHDKHFLSGDEDVCLSEDGDHVSILFGLTDITYRNGMIEVLPGTHRQIPGFVRDLRPYHLRPKEDHFLTNIPEALLATRRGVPITAGSFFMFDSSLLHRSLEHRGGAIRLGLAIRLVRKGRRIPTALAEPAEVIDFSPAE